MTENVKVKSAEADVAPVEVQQPDMEAVIVSEGVELSNTKVGSAKKAAAKTRTSIAANADTKDAGEKSAPGKKPSAKPAKKARTDVQVEAVTATETDKATKAKKHAPRKPKMVRDSFTFPENDYALFSALKQRALASGTDVKKSELLRAGLALLASLEDAQFSKALSDVERIKTGRPKS